ncbi:MFS transporter [Microbacterium gorillae]|uniref:MFS transporter n=1 Tax=Microbacterium gorillae TaxID=1231063 RepID=UPI00058BBCDC|nr:MFS transporter [Microbacterium gorillae]
MRPSHVWPTLATLAMFVALGVLDPTLALFIDTELGHGGWVLGLAIGARTVGACVAAPIAGFLTTRCGTARVTIIGLVLVALSIAGYLVVDDVAPLILLRLLGGIGEAAAFVGLIRSGYDLATPAGAQRATVVLTTALFVGLGSGAVLGESVRLTYGFPGVWIVAACTALLGAAAALPLLRVAAVTRRARVSLRSTPLLHGGSLGFAGVVVFGMAAFAAFSTFVPIRAAELGLTDSGSIFALSAGIIIAIRVLAAVFGEVGAPSRIVVFSLLACGGGWTLVAVLPSVVGLYLGVAVASVGFALLYPTLLHAAVGGAGDANRGGAVATLTLAYDAAQGVGAIALGGAASVAGGASGAFVLAAALPLLGVVAAVAVFRRTSRDRHGTMVSDGQHG